MSSTGENGELCSYLTVRRKIWKNLSPPLLQQFSGRRCFKLASQSKFLALCSLTYLAYVNDCASKENEGCEALRNTKINNRRFLYFQAAGLLNFFEASKILKLGKKSKISIKNNC